MVDRQNEQDEYIRLVLCTIDGIKVNSTARALSRRTVQWAGYEFKVLHVPVHKTGGYLRTLPLVPHQIKETTHMSSRRGTTIRHHGVSKKSIIHSGRRASRLEKTVLSASKQDDRKREYETKRRAIIEGLTEEDRQAVAEMDIDMFGSADDVTAADQIAPPDEQAFNISHEGGEFKVFKNLTHEIAYATGYYKQVDHRTRRDRTERTTQNWLDQIDRLVEAYLDFRSRQGEDGKQVHGNAMEDTNATGSITIEVVDLFCRKTSVFKTLESDEYPNEILLRNGYLGCSALTPTVAISLRTLSLYRQIHRTCPRFSLEAMSKTLCHLHNVPYRKYLRNQFMVSFDAYLEICRRVNQKLDDALGYDSSNRLQRVCPACFNRVPGEEEQEFSVLLSIDGNNSLKRISSTIRGKEELSDSRSIRSNRWLASDEVDQFKDEVLNTKEAADNFADEIAPPAQQSADSGKDFDCIDRWKNAGPTSRKRMFSLFDETGIFIACCRHRMVIYGCDMRKSGELAKYPLAIVNRMLQEMGNNVGCAYDIGCEFSKTVARSTLGKRAADQNLQFMVGAFHGHAHKRSCQLSWHPLYIKGTGRTEGEGCEHIFSSSNDLARNTRHATRFHRLQAIDEHFNFWDEDKYALLSTFIINHYEEAIKTIRNLERDLHVIKEQLHLTDEDLAGIFEEEKKYFENLLQPPIDVQLKTEYVRALKDWTSTMNDWRDAVGAARNLYNTVATPNLHWAISQARHRIDLMALKMEAAQNHVLTLEAKLQITERWTASSPDYKKYYEENVKTEYQKALDDLERLAVMRLFEFNKMNESGLGYKLRDHIWGALKRRSEAVRNAIIRYNVQAERFDPPRQPLSLDQVTKSTSSFLAEFEVLRFAQREVQDKAWVRPACREASVKYYKLCRAREEVKRLNLEVRRLQVSIDTEITHTVKVLEEISTQNPLLGIELKRRWRARSLINNLHLCKLAELRDQVYFTGMRWDRVNEEGEGVDEDASDGESESEREREFDTMTEFIEGITD